MQESPLERKSVVMIIRRFRVYALLVLALSLWTLVSASAAEKKSAEKSMVFKNVKAQTQEFIGYYRSIALTAEQLKLKERALGSIPAPCCQEYSAATCCCPCNFAKSVWGLSNYLIAKRNYSEAQLKQTVTEWVKFTHPHGYAGNACQKGRCGVSFAEDGCGGMNETQLVF